jgi:MFS family permease
MSVNRLKTWVSIVVVVLAGSVATALVPQTVPILGAIAKTFHVSGASLGWIVSFPTLACAVGALAFGFVVDRVGDVRLLLVGVVLVILGDAGASLAPALQWLIAARLFQGLGYVSISVAGPTFIQRISTGDTRRAAMAFWVAHTPIGFATAVFVAAHLVAAGFSWRWSFLGHAGAALLVGIAALGLRRAPSAANVSRSAGTRQVLTSARAYAVAGGALAAGMFQVGVMTLLPAMLAETHGLSGPQAAIIIVVAMLANWGGTMLIVATRLRSFPAVALPVSATVTALLGFLTVSGLGVDLPMQLAYVFGFAAAIGTANSLVWSLLPAAVPSPEAAGATAGLVTQGSFLGVLFSPPIFFGIRHGNPLFLAALALILAILMSVALFAYAPAGRSGVAKALRAVDSH